MSRSSSVRSGTIPVLPKGETDGMPDAIIASVRCDSCSVSTRPDVSRGVIRYGLIDDSCGSGRFRGGLGLRRVYEVTAENVEFSCYGDRFRQRPEGLLGGTPGRNARCTIERDGVASGS